MAADTGIASAASPPGLHTLDDGHGLVLTVAERGATWRSCRVPLAGGGTREVLIGAPDGSDACDDSAYRGAVVGRVANRLAGARFTLDGRAFALLANEGPHQLHGGPDGFHRRRWALRSASPRELQLVLRSPDGDQGYPGNLQVDLTYRIDAPGTVSIAWQARCSAPCPVNLTAHPYFNLDGEAGSVAGHRLQIRASRVLQADAEGLPTGVLLPVAGSGFDLRSPAPALGPQGTGFDHCWVLDADCAGASRAAAMLQSSDGRLTLTLHTTLPGLQCYTGARLAGLTGRDGRPLPAQAGIALEPQYFPDAANHPAWQAPGYVLRPGQMVSHRIVYRFRSDTAG